MSNEVKWEMLASMGWSNNVWYNGEMNDRLKKSNQHKRWNEKRFPSNHCGWKNEHQVIRWRRIHCKKPYFNPFHQDREPLQRQHDHDCFPNSNYQWLPMIIYKRGSPSPTSVGVFGPLVRLSGSFLSYRNPTKID